MADDEAFLGEMLERQRELRAALRPMVDELHELREKIAATEKALAEWSERRPG